MNRHAMGMVEHVSCGNVLKDACEWLNDLLTSFPPSSKPSRQARHALKSLDDLRSTLDSQVCAAVPEARDPRGMAIKVYFGRCRLESVPYDRDARATDAFAGFREQD